jgi:hypothetical protein
MGVSKQEFMSLFIQPQTKEQQPINKKHICMDWCIHPQFNDD